MALENKKVAVVGCGGLGGYVIEQLARLGVGHLVLIDGDEFSESNMNRQLLATRSTIGKSKVESYVNKINKINSGIKVDGYHKFLNEENVNLLDGCDLVVDCLDNVESRFTLSKACKSKSIAIVHGAIGTDNGQVALFLPSDKGIEKLYKNVEDQPVPTTSYAVAIVASLQVCLADKYLNNNYSDIKDNLYLIDLDTLEIKKIKA